MRLDFTIETDEDILKELIDNHYYQDNIIYTSPKNCLRYPGVFYLTPYNPVLIKHALALYLAAFDGHKEIFMIGYNNQTTTGNLAWQAHVAQVFSAYSGTKFVIVGMSHHAPAGWLEFANVERMTYREFISYCDV
jgi:hypothetical protein